MRVYGIAALVALPLAAQTEPAIRVPVRLVTVPALVFSRHGRLLPGLTAGNFRVFDNGRPQAVALDTEPLPVSVVLVVQANLDARSYLPFIARVGNTVEALLAGFGGETALIAYNDDVVLRKGFEGDLSSALRGIAAAGHQARMLDAGLRALELLRDRPGARSRVLLFVGQPMDDGSQSTVAAVAELAARNDVSVYALTLPEFGLAFVSDTFALSGAPQAKGGFQAGVDLKKLASVLRKSSAAAHATDPFSILTNASGGTQLHFRKQIELENALSILGVELRSRYLLHYYPDSDEAGYHTIRVEVDVAGAEVHARPGYYRE